MPTISMEFSEPLTPFSVETSNVTLVGFPSIPVTKELSPDGRTVTITPQNLLVPQRQYSLWVSGFRDLAGNFVNLSSHRPLLTFKTGDFEGVDNTRPFVVSVSPPDGAPAVVGIDTVLTFSEPVLPDSLNNNVALILDGNVRARTAATSLDNTVVFMNFGDIPIHESEVAVVVTEGVTDFAGNPAIPFESHFTTTANPVPPLLTLPFFASTRPANGANDVLPGKPISLFFHHPLDPTTVPGSVRVSQDGMLISGSYVMGGDDKVVTFTPPPPFPLGAFVEVFLTPDLRTAEGLAPFEFTQKPLEFRLAVPAEETPLRVTGFAPNGHRFVLHPLNSEITVRFNKPMNPSTLNIDSVIVSRSLTPIPVSLSLDPTGTVLMIMPDALLPANSSILVRLTEEVKDLFGNSLSSLNFFQFRTGDHLDTVAPTLASISPADGATGVGVNAELNLAFSDEINTLKVTEPAVRLLEGGTTVEACSLLFSGNRLVTLIPQSALKANATYTVEIDSLTDVAGNVIPAAALDFQTGSGADLDRPRATSISPQGEHVPTNAIVRVAFTEPLNRTTVTDQTLFVRPSGSQENLPTTVTFDASGGVVFLTPDSLLVPNTTHTVTVTLAVRDVSGNPSVGGDRFFKTGSSVDTIPPVVTRVSPPDGATGIARNTRVAVLLSEPVRPSSVTPESVALLKGADLVPVSLELLEGNQSLQLTVPRLLDPLTPYTVRIEGLADLADNVMAAPLQTMFTTSEAVDITQPAVASFSPPHAASNVPLDTSVVIEFDEPLNPLVVTKMFFILNPSETGFEVSLDATGTVVTLAPASSLMPDTEYHVVVDNKVADLAGNVGLSSSLSHASFTTGN